MLTFSVEKMLHSAKIGGLTGGVFEVGNLAINGRQRLDPEDYITDEDHRAPRGGNEMAGALAGALTTGADPDFVVSAREKTRQELGKKYCRKIWKGI